MGYEFSGNINNYSKEDIWTCVEKICLSLNNLHIVDSGNYFYNLNYVGNENTKWGSDIGIGLKEDLGLYILFNLAPDENLISLIISELEENNINIELEEL